MLVQTFFVEPKIYLHTIVPVTNILCQTKRWIAFSKIVFCVDTKLIEEALCICNEIFWLAQNIWTGTKYFWTCKRTRHEGLLLKFSCTVICNNAIAKPVAKPSFFWNIFFLHTRSNFQFQNEKNPAYRISSYSFRPWIVSAPLCIVNFGLTYCDLWISKFKNQ